MGDIPRDEPGRSEGGHLQRRCRSEGFSQDAGLGVSEDRVRGACLLSDDQSLSSGSGDAGGKLGGGNALTFECLHDPVQPLTQADRTRVQRTLQGAVGQRRQRRVPEDRLRLRASQSSKGEAARKRGAFAELSVEQPDVVFGGAKISSTVDEDGSAAGRTRDRGRYGGRTKGLRGRAGGGSERCAMGACATGLVSGWRDVPQRDGGANGRRLKRASFGRTAAGECGGAGGADRQNR